MIKTLLKYICFPGFVFILSQSVYAMYGSFQLILDGYQSNDEAFVVASTLKKQGIIKQINIQGILLDNNWEYIVVIESEISKSSAEKIAYKLNKLSYKNTMINNLKTEQATPSLTAKDIIDKEVEPKDDEIILLDDSEAPGNKLNNVPSLIEDEVESSSIEWSGSAQIEQQVFTRSESPVDQLQFLHMDLGANWHINENWNLKLGGRVDGNYQHGINKSDDTQLDYTDSYLRYRDDHYRFTLGAQTIRWGRMDSFSPTDRLAVVDLSRGVLPDLGENYRAVAALRGELFFEQSKVDLVYIPKFRAAELAEEDQVWFPINFYEGRVLGFSNDPVMSEVIKNSNINDNYSRKDSFSARFSSSMNAIDYSLSAQRIQLSTPYYHYDSQFADLMNNPSPQFIALLQSGSLAETLYEEHPENWVVGADMEFEWNAMTWRFESAWLSDMPATTSSLEYKTYNGMEWAGGMEFYPGDRDTRLNVQLTGKHIFNKENIIDRDNVLSLSGEVESEFNNGKWSFNTRYSFGLDMKDIYIAPKLSYFGWESYELYIAYHYLDGAEESVGGFFENNKMLNLGFKLKN